MTSFGEKNRGLVVHLLSSRDPVRHSRAESSGSGLYGLEFRGNTWARDVKCAHTLPMVVTGVVR